MNKLLCILLGLLTCLSIPLQAAAPSVSGLIEAGRRGKGYVVNTPKYNRKAKVFYLCYLGYNVKDRLEEISTPLIPMHEEIESSGAELILYLDFPPEQNGNDSKSGKNKKKGKSRGVSGSGSLKCPIVNIFHAKARETLFQKDARGKEYSYGTYDLRAVNAAGRPLAYFKYTNGAMTMIDAQTGELKEIGTGSYTGNEWVGPAILASYKDLLEQVSPSDASDEATREESESPKKSKKKSGKKRTTSKNSRIMTD